MSDALRECVHLKKYFDTPGGKLHAVDDISFRLERGKTLGVVGESGCGKFTLGRTILRLVPHTSGQVLYQGQDILKYSKREMRMLRAGRRTPSANWHCLCLGAGAEIYRVR